MFYDPVRAARAYADQAFRLSETEEQDVTAVRDFLQRSREAFWSIADDDGPAPAT